MGHDDPVSIAESKAAMRAEVRAARAARGEAERAAASLAIVERARTLVAPHAAVSAYLSMPTEPGTHGLVAALLGDGHRVVLPRINGARLDWIVMHPGTALRRGPMGIREPEGPAVDPAALSDLDVMLIPGLAVDREGHRLGQGGGYYDATLAAVPTHAEGGPVRVMLLFDEEVRDAIPVDEHDCLVDVAITPSVVHRFPEGR